MSTMLTARQQSIAGRRTRECEHRFSFHSPQLEAPSIAARCDPPGCVDRTAEVELARLAREPRQLGNGARQEYRAADVAAATVRQLIT